MKWPQNRKTVLKSAKSFDLGDIDTVQYYDWEKVPTCRLKTLEMKPLKEYFATDLKMRLRAL